MRTKVTNKELYQEFGDKDSRKYRMMMRKMHGEYKVQQLYSNLVVPSYVHGYSLAIEFMREWFLEKFPKNYFKTVYVNGKHVLDDYKIFNKDVIKKEKPMVAIVPTVDYEFDRENVDLYTADPEIFLKRSNFQQSFFKDDERNLYVGFDYQALRMTFNYRIRVSSRAQQLDLFKRIELMFRIGATQQEHISADFHIPKEIILDIAEKAGFEVDYENKKVKNMIEFMSYLNSHSELPFLFKMRAINQKPEYFIRLKDLYVHINCTDRLNIDDGERDGQLDNNFHIEMQAIVTIPIPHYYVYFNQQPLMGGVTIHEPDDKVTVGLYSFNEYKLPDKNERGWYEKALTSYLCDKHEPYVDMTEIFSGHNNMDEVIRYNMTNFISPTSFVDIQVFRNDDRALRVKTRMNWENMHLEFKEDMDEETVLIAIYADDKYINDIVTSIANLRKSRVEKE